MLIGRYGNTTGRPFMTAHVLIASLGISGSVSFLMDTGADKTVLMPADIRRLGIRYGSLKTAADSVGVGGASHDFREKGALLVEDGSVLHGYEVEFLLMRRKRVLENTPSLLGRNIMNRWKITFDYANRSVIAEIRDSDVQIPLPDRM